MSALERLYRSGYRRNVSPTCVTWFSAAELDQALALWPSMIDWDYIVHDGVLQVGMGRVVRDPDDLQR